MCLCVNVYIYMRVCVIMCVDIHIYVCVVCFRVFLDLSHVIHTHVHDTTLQADHLVHNGPAYARCDSDGDCFGSSVCDMRSRSCVCSIWQGRERFGMVRAVQ